jgi:hypothetical protein
MQECRHLASSCDNVKMPRHIKPKRKHAELVGMPITLNMPWHLHRVHAALCEAGFSGMGVAVLKESQVSGMCSSMRPTAQHNCCPLSVGRRERVITSTITKLLKNELRSRDIPDSKMDINIFLKIRDILCINSALRDTKCLQPFQREIINLSCRNNRKRWH